MTVKLNGSSSKMSMEFDCGTVVKSVGAPGMAIASHIKTCKDAACVTDCKKELGKYKNVIVDA